MFDFSLLKFELYIVQFCINTPIRCSSLIWTLSGIELETNNVYWFFVYYTYLKLFSLFFLKMERDKTENNYARHYITADELMWWPHHLPRECIERGMSCVKQADGSWTSGPNSGVRALYMWGKGDNTVSYYNSFVNDCPKSFGSPHTTASKTWNDILGILTLGISSAIVNNIRDIGPNPSELGNYLSEWLGSDGNAGRFGYSGFSNALDAIKNDLDNGNPVITLLARSWDSMHYINVVGVSQNNDIAVLDTDNTLYYYTENDFEDQMDVRSYPFLSDNYVLIHFWR